MASAALDERRIPGVSLVVLQRDETLLARGHGFADDAQEVPASATTVFQLGSISKQFLALGPGPTTRLRHVGNGTFVCESDPDACQLTVDGRDMPAKELRLFMGAMHCYGVRRP